jgi:hypothetical protein
VETKSYQGSRAGCLRLTETVADRLERIVKPYATLDPEGAVYFPRGPKHVQEAKLGEADGLLSPEDREAVTAWWLAIRPGANTPNWDIACECLVGSRPGLILVEAKAHHDELDPKGKLERGNPQNDTHIRSAIKEASAALEANGALEGSFSGWKLSPDSHYQLCNRFAWGWKVASLGIPVILVYLGFLNVTDMPGCKVFRTAEEWTQAVHNHAQGIVPRDAWGTELNVNGTPLIPLIRSWPAAW